MNFKGTEKGTLFMLQLSNRRLKLAATALSVFAVLPASAQIINEDIKIVASDAAVGDIFGGSIAISGTTAIVGSLFDDDAGSASGSAYLFDTETGQELFKLTANDAAEGDQFGISVAISGTTAIVGAFGDDDAGDASGSAYLFDTETGQQLFKLTADDAASGDLFGTSVAISGTIAIIGAQGDDDAGDFTGSAYLFDTVTGQQLFKLTASDADAVDRFGNSVDISGSTAIVGAPNNSDAGQFSGSAYLFDTETGQQLIKLTAPDAAAGDNFGTSVGISGMTAIVGTFIFNDDDSEFGSAYLFDIENGIQIAKLIATDAAGEDLFGTSVAISGTTAIVGASKNNDAGTDSGSAYLFESATGQALSKLTASDAASGDQFGRSVSISGTTAIVGAPNDIVEFTESGSAYVFDTVVEPCPADITGDGQLNFFDVSRFLTFFQIKDPIADFTGDGLFNFFDVSAFLQAFAAGCP
jgi:FG-GAP repeat